MSGAVLAGMLALALTGAGTPTVAQQPAGGPDSAVAQLRERLVTLRDTVRSVTASIGQFRRDLGAAGPETITQKAERLSGVCAGARSTLVASLPGFGPTRVPPGARVAADSLRTTIRALVDGLDRHCITGLAPAGPGSRPDSLRAWGPYRAAQLRHLIGRFNNDANRVAAAAGFKLPVAGR